MTNVALPLDAADETLIERDILRGSVSALEAEVAALGTIRDQAAYWVGPEECSDGECDEAPDNPETPCPHVDVRYATYADVLVRERLEYVLTEVLAGLSAPTTPTPAADLIDTIETTIYTLADQLDDIPGGDRIQALPLYRNIVDSVMGPLRAERERKKGTEPS